MIRKLGLAFAVALSVPLTVAVSTPASACGHIAMFVEKSYSATEPGMVTVAIRRDANACGGPSSVDYTTVDGNAKAGSDYTATSGTVTFNNPEAADAQRTFTVPILDDAEAEGAESFTVMLKMNAVQGGAITSIGSPTTVTIAANDQPAATSPPATAAPPTTAPPTTAAPAPAPAPASAAPTKAAPTTVRPAPTTAAPAAAPTSAPVATTTTVVATVETLAPTVEETTTTTEAVADDELAAAPASSDGGGGGGGAIIGILALALVIGGGIGYWLWRRAQPSTV